MTIYNDGKQLDVPIIIGTNANEGNRFVTDITLSQYSSWVRKLSGTYTDQALEMFPADNDKVADSAYYTYMTIYPFTEPARYVARQMAKKNSNVYLYQFSRIPNTEIGRTMGAAHGIELDYVFGYLDEAKGYDKTDLALSQSIMKYWTNFAKTKNPNAPDLPYWPVYNRATDKNINFADAISVNENLAVQSCDLIDKVMTEDQKQLQQRFEEKK